MTTVRIAGIFPLEVKAYPNTYIGWVHILAVLFSFYALTLAITFLLLRFKRDEKWRRFRRSALILALVTLVASIMFFYKIMFPSNRIFNSLNPGIFIASGLATGIVWLLLTAVRLRFSVYGLRV